MTTAVRTFFDHSRHTLRISSVAAQLDVLAFEGTEQLSRPYHYRVEFTCAERDLVAQDLLNGYAYFSLHPAPPRLPRGVPLPVSKPLRTFNAAVTGFKRLSGSRDEARYEVTLQPRFALLARGKQFRIYQHQSVPEIVEHILRSRHDFEGQHFYFKLVREYPRREQVMQYDESDLAFIDRLLAEVGIWYRFVNDERLYIDVVEFRDDQRHYLPGLELAYQPQSGLASIGQDSVWGLQTAHQVVDKQIHFRAYHYRDALAFLDGEVDQSRRAKGTYGEAYHYAEPYRVLGDRLDQDEDLESESGFFYARLRHERYLNDRTRLIGTSSSAALAPSQVLKIAGAPQAFAPGAVIVQLTTTAARDRSFVATFDAIPYANEVCYRPPLLPKPCISGTVPARVSNPQPNDPYAEIDIDGRYRVHFLFDRDTWQPGRESLWMRLARPYAGDTHGLHLPLLAGTEVAVAFEQGDPDRPYIAHALHDSDHPDPVTLRNYKRNVLRTPANNKLRLDDTRGQEHIKLSTEHSGKSQLNLGHLVDADKRKRGEGFELRSDGWGAIRGGKGVFISADEQARANGDVLSMAPATRLIDAATRQLANCQEIARAHHSRTPSIDGLKQLQSDARDLSAPAILLSAPNGVAAVTPASLLLGSGDALHLQSQHDINVAAAKGLSAQANLGISLLAQQEGLRLVSGKGPLEIESHGDVLDLKAQQDITVQSVQGHVQVTARNGITLGCGGGFIRITPQGEIQIHGPGLISIKGKHRLNPPTSEAFPLPELPGSVCKECLKRARTGASGFMSREVSA